MTQYIDTNAKTLLFPSHISILRIKFFHDINYTANLFILIFLLVVTFSSTVEANQDDMEVSLDSNMT